MHKLAVLQKRCSVLISWTAVQTQEKFETDRTGMGELKSVLSIYWNITVRHSKMLIPNGSWRWVLFLGTPHTISYSSPWFQGNYQWVCAWLVTSQYKHDLALIWAHLTCHQISTATTWCLHWCAYRGHCWLLLVFLYPLSWLMNSGKAPSL